MTERPKNRRYAQVSRRQLLLGGGAACTLMAAPFWPGLGAAQDAPQQKNLIVVLADGGWDVTGCLDPKPGLASVDAMPGDVRLFGQLPICVHETRSESTRFFERYGANCVSINGIQVRSIAHKECTKRILTGTNDSRNPDIGAMVGAMTGRELAVPYMVLGDTAFVGPYAGLSGRSGVAGQFSRLLDPAGAYATAFGQRTQRFDPTADELALIRRHVHRRITTHKNVRGHTEKSRQRLEEYADAFGRSDQLKPLFQGLGEVGFQLEFEPQIQLATTLIKRQMSRAVCIEDPGNWDTHNDSVNRQTVRYQALFTGLNSLAESMVANDIFDSTVVVVMSEMSRTPKLNEQMGKDHWPVTSALVFGGGLSGGRTLGGTDQLVRPQNIHLATGSMDANGTPLSSASFVAGLLSLMGVDSQPFFPNVEALRGFTV